MRPQGEKMELHHKVPIFLGGSEEEWNLEWITLQKHLNRHIEIAEEINTFKAWASVIQCLRGKTNLIYNKEYVYKRFGDSQKGENNPSWKGGIGNCSKCNKQLSARKYAICGSCKALESTHKRKKVICLMSGEIFDGYKTAANKFNLTYKQLLYRLDQNTTSLRRVKCTEIK